MSKASVGRPRVHTEFDPPEDLGVGRPRVHTEFDPPEDLGIDCSVLPSMTKQSFKDECDINNIMRHFQETGSLDDGLSDDVGRFLDVANVVDYHTAQNMLIEAQKVFAEMPVKIRRRFADDPARFLDFIDHLDEHEAEARDLGILKPIPATQDKAGEGAAPSGSASAPAPAGAPEGAPKAS